MIYVRAYTYDTQDPTYFNPKGDAMQRTWQWFQLVQLLGKLGITVLY